MRKIFLWGAIFIAGIVLTACGGGSSGSDSDDSAEPSVFTQQMLDASPTYYVSYPGSSDGSIPDGTTQEELAFNGSKGTYVVTVTSSYFDASNTFVNSEVFLVDLVLNQDGTLTAISRNDPTSPITFSLSSVTNHYLDVTGTDDTGSWSDPWYLSQPAGWLYDTTASSGFTAQMLDASPTYYVFYRGNPGGSIQEGTTQEVISFSGSNGTYVASFTESYFDASDALVSTETVLADIVLNQDGTLTASVTGDPTPTTMTLTSTSANSLHVTETHGAETWSDPWYLSQPAGWLSETTTISEFTREMLNTSPTYYISYAGAPDGSTQDGTTQEVISFNGSNGTYTIVFTESYFNASNGLVSSDAFLMTGILNQDGTLKVYLAGDPSSTTIFSISSSTVSYLNVSGTNNTETWSDFWYFSQPVGWLDETSGSNGFTTQILNASPTYYISYAGASDGSTQDGTTQEIISFSGSNGTYIASFTESYFDANDALVSKETVLADIVLNQDGTLTASPSGDPSDTTIFSVTTPAATYLLVSGTNSTETWSDYWYMSQPAGWLYETVASSGFTAQVLDASPTYYVTYRGNSGGSIQEGTTQEVISFSGSNGTYVASFTESYFNAADFLISTETVLADIVLNQDGTLTASVTGDPTATTLTLTSTSANSLHVTETHGSETWADAWYFSQPAGWLSETTIINGFTTEFLNTSPKFYLSFAGPSDGSTQEGTTQVVMSFNGSNGTYTIICTESYFDASNSLVSSINYLVTGILNQDGTLTTYVPGDSSDTTLFAVTSPTATYLDVSRTRGTETFSDYWYFSKPAGWLN